VTQQTIIRQPFDPELEPILEAFSGLLPRISDESLQQMRRFSEEGIPGVEKPDFTAGGKVRVEQIRVPGPEGAPDIVLHVLTPTTGDGPWPLLYNTHGGGMVVGTGETEIPLNLKYVAEGLAVFVAVDYRLAPEHPDPAPIEDCYAGLVWSAQNAERLNIYPERIIVCGVSAGGGLAAGTTLLARDRGFPAVAHQILVCPMLDDRFETPSSQMLDGEGTWDRNDNMYGWTSLLGDRRGGPDVSIYAAPARAEDLSGLPHAYVDVGGAETFRDEAITYAQRMMQAGVSVDLHVWSGGFHGFDAVAPQAGISQASLYVRDEFIRRALAS